MRNEMLKVGTSARIALLLTFAAPSLVAQQGAGEGFLFRPPPATITFFGGLASPFARGGVHELATSELTVDRGDFRTASWGGAVAVGLSERWDVVLGFESARSINRSEYRDWVDDNDQPIRQSTRFDRIPLTASMRYYFADRGRRIGSVAWIPATVVPFVQAGLGTMRYRFEQYGDFVDQETLNIFTDQFTTTGWAMTMQASAGAQWNLNHRFLLTGEARYLHAVGDGDAPSGEYAGYTVNLSGVSTLIGLTLRF